MSWKVFESSPLDSKDWNLQVLRKSECREAKLSQVSAAKLLFLFREIFLALQGT
jgi:hypothetical protein